MDLMTKEDQKTEINQNAIWEAKILLEERILDKTNINVYMFTNPKKKCPESRTLQGNMEEYNQTWRLSRHSGAECATHRQKA